jgi:flagellar basal body-associated protein FliL
LNLRIHRRVILDSPESQRRMKISRSKAVIIVIVVIVAAVIAGIGVVTALTTSSAHANIVSSKQCGPPAPTKMFDEESVPKYIIGPGYKVIPVAPTTTEVMITSCT